MIYYLKQDTLKNLWYWYSNFILRKTDDGNKYDYVQEISYANNAYA